MSSTPSSLKAVIFDLDGTVLDTIADLAGAVNAALSKNGFPIRTHAEVMSFVGNGTLKLIERALPEESRDKPTVERVHGDFSEYYSQHFADETKPYPGIPELLKKLKNAGYKLAVSSNKPDRFTKELIGRFYPGIFDIVIGSSEVTPRKPDPTGEYSILAKFGVSPFEAIHVGDSDTDVKTAHNAGVACLACTWGYRSKETLMAADADFIVEKVAEMERFFEKTVDILFSM